MTVERESSVDSGGTHKGSWFWVSNRNLPNTYPTESDTIFGFHLTTPWHRGETRPGLSVTTTFCEFILYIMSHYFLYLSIRHRLPNRTNQSLDLLSFNLPSPVLPHPISVHLRKSLTVEVPRDRVGDLQCWLQTFTIEYSYPVVGNPPTTQGSRGQVSYLT